MTAQKQMEVKQKQIGENTFYIKPFSAFTAANISGDLAAVLSPMLGALAPLLSTESRANIEDDAALEALGNAFSGLSGDTVERLFKKLLIDSKNISAEAEATDWKVKLMTLDLANEIFCGSVEEMYMLCLEVIKINFGGFFRKLGIQFGSQNDTSPKTIPSTKSGEH